MNNAIDEPRNSQNSQQKPRNNTHTSRSTLQNNLKQLRQINKRADNSNNHQKPVQKRNPRMLVRKRLQISTLTKLTPMNMLNTMPSHEKENNTKCLSRFSNY